MIVKVNGEEVDVAKGMTFSELIEYVQGLLNQEVLVELRIDQQTISQSLLDKICDEPICGEIELLSLDAYTLMCELIKRAGEYLRGLEEEELTREDLPRLVEGFQWLNFALTMVPLEGGSPETRARILETLQRNTIFCKRLSEVSEDRQERVEKLKRGIALELAAYRSIFEEMGKEL